VRQTLTIGRYPEVSLTDARDALGKARRLVAQGTSPAEAKREALAQARVARTNTVQAFGEQWYHDRAESRLDSTFSYY